MWGLIQVLDLRSWAWSKLEAKIVSDTVESPAPVNIDPCAGHSLVSRELSSFLVSIDFSKVKFSNEKNAHFIRICLLKIVFVLIVFLQLYHFTLISLPLLFFSNRYLGKTSFFQLLAIVRILLTPFRVLVSALYTNF